MARVEIYSDYLKGASPFVCEQRSILASGKVGWSNPSAEGSQTAKPCSDGQKLHMRLQTVVEQAHHCKGRAVGGFE
jgi:hypothetical protein